MDNYTEFNKEQFVEEKIWTQLKDLRNLCKLNGVPFLATVAISNNMTSKHGKKEGCTKYKYCAALTGSSNIKLYDDKFVEMELIMAGMKAVRPGTLGPDSFGSEALEYIQNIPEEISSTEEIGITDESADEIMDLGDL